MEEWREVPGNEWMQASSIGRIRVLPYTSVMPNGGARVYEVQPTFGVWDGKRFIIVIRRRSYRVARLVCLAFNGLPPEGKDVCMHKDENSRNNVPDNLEWGTQKENLNASGFLEYCKGRTGENSPRRKGLCKR